MRSGDHGFRMFVLCEVVDAPGGIGSAGCAAGRGGILEFRLRAIGREVNRSLLRREPQRDRAADSA
ncbi:hypothetical protein D3C83_62960 [compost metagenome]